MDTMEERKNLPAMTDIPDGLEYPVEFELRVIHVLAEGPALAAGLGRVLSERGAALETPRALPSKSAKYGRLACRVRFEDKDGLYAAYAAIGALPGVKAVL